MHLETAIAAGVAVTACYTYRPLAITAPQPGTPIAATLTETGSQELASYLGPDVRVVRGRCLGSADGVLAIAVTSIELDRGTTLSWQGEAVKLPERLIARVDEPRLAKGRSALVAGSSVAALAAVYGAFNLIGSGSSAAGGPPPSSK